VDCAKNLVLNPDRGAGADDRIPALIESEFPPEEFRQNRARLIRKIYQVDPQFIV